MTSERQSACMREARPLLSSGAAVVFQVCLDDAAWDSFTDALATDERRRASTYRTVLLQDHFRRCRAALRRFLSMVSGQRPEQIAFAYGPFEKPACPGLPVHFNVSHSDGTALIGVAPQPIGVDIEWMGAPRDIAALTGMVCHPTERRMLNALPPSERHVAFHQLWTRKEAYCKALGTGIQDSLGHITFLERDGERPTWQVVDAATDASPHVVQAVPCPAGYAASVGNRGLQELRVVPLTVNPAELW